MKHTVPDQKKGLIWKKLTQSLGSDLFLKNGVGGCNLHIQTIQCPVTVAKASKSAGEWKLPGKLKGHSDGFPACFRGSRFQPRWSDVSRVVWGLHGMEYGGSSPTFKIQKSFWGTFPFFWNGANQNKQSGIFRRKTPRVLKTVFVLQLVVRWFSGWAYLKKLHLSFDVLYTSLYIHTITYLVLKNLGDLMTKGYQRPRSNQQHMALAHKLFNPKTLHAEVTWKFATLAWQESASRRSFEDTPWTVFFFFASILVLKPSDRSNSRGDWSKFWALLLGLCLYQGCLLASRFFSLFLHGFTLLLACMPKGYNIMISIFWQFFRTWLFFIKQIIIYPMTIMHDI